MNDIIINLIDDLKNHRSIAFIGLGKNVGKTTTLNAISSLLNYENLILTSIGYDGETSDLVFNTPKPKIYVKSGTIIATAKKCVLESNFTYEVLNKTNYNTPLGYVIIIKALNDGYVKLAGPSHNSQLKLLIDELGDYNPKAVILVDGAIDRKVFSNPYVCDAAILSMSMNISSDFNTNIAKAVFEYNILNLNEYSIKFNVDEVIVVKKTQLINTRLNSTFDDISTINKLLTEVTAIYFNGIINDKHIEYLLKNKIYVDIIVDNANAIFISESLFKNSLSYLNYYVNHKINVMAVSVNPNNFDSREVIDELSKYISIPIINFKE